MKKAKLQALGLDDLKSRKWHTIVALAFVVLNLAASLIFAFRENEIYQSIRHHNTADAETLNSFFDMLQNHTLIMLTLFVLMVISISFWMYRITYNYHALNVNNLKFSPANAVIWFYIPIANFIMPYNRLAKLYNIGVDPVNWFKKKGYPLFITLLAMLNFITYVAGRNIAKDYESESVDIFVTSIQHGSYLMLLNAVVLVLWLGVIYSISNKQLMHINSRLNHHK